MITQIVQTHLNSIDGYVEQANQIKVMSIWTRRAHKGTRQVFGLDESKSTHEHVCWISLLDEYFH